MVAVTSRDAVWLQIPVKIHNTLLTGVYSSTPNMDATGPSETLVIIEETTWCHILGATGCQLANY